MEQTYPELTLRDYLRVLFRQKAVIITCFITVMVTVIIGLQFRTPVYQASVKMLISAEKLVDSPYYRELLGTQGQGVTVLTQSEIVTSNPIIERAVKATGLYQRPLNYEKNFASWIKKPFISLGARNTLKQLKGLTDKQKQGVLFRFAVEDLKQHIKVEPIRDTNLFTISLTDFSPVGAAVLANVVSRSYVIFDLEQQLSELQLRYGEKHLSVTQMSDNIEKMAKSLSGEPLSDVEAIGPASVKVIEQAQVPIKPEGPPNILIAILAFFMSIFLGVMLAFAFEYMDQTFKTPQEAESFLNLPFLGSVPRKAQISSYHTLADQVYLLMKDKGLRTLLLGSALEKEGVTTTVHNLGVYLSKTAGHKALIIDANLRNPGVYKFPKAGEGHGLCDVLEDKATFEKAVKDIGNNLHILPAGKTDLNPITLLSSHKMQEVLKLAKEKYQIVLIDSPAFIGFSDGVMLSTSVDAVALVVNEGKTRKQVVKAALEPLIEKRANVIGVILNNRTFVIPKAIYDRI